MIRGSSKSQIVQ